MSLPWRPSARVIGVAVGVVALVSCTTVSPDDTSGGDGPPATSSDEPAVESPACETDDLGAFAEGVTYEGVFYERLYSTPMYAQPDQVGELVGTVGCGDRVLAPGSPVTGGYEVWEFEGFARSFRLIGERAEGLVVFERRRVTGPSARAVFGDLDDQVVSINVNSEFDGTTTLGAITDPTLVAQMVSDLLDGPTFDRGGGVGTAYFLDLHFAQGPPSSHLLWVDSARLGTGIEVPDRFVDAVLDAVTAYESTTTTTVASANTWVLPPSPSDGEVLVDAFLSLPGVEPLRSVLHVETASTSSHRAFLTEGDPDTVVISGTIGIEHTYQPSGFDPEATYGQPADVIANTLDPDGQPVIPTGTTIYMVIAEPTARLVVGVDEQCNVIEVMVEPQTDASLLTGFAQDDIVGWIVGLLEAARAGGWGS